jgi:hypothetical protein
MRSLQIQFFFGASSLRFFTALRRASSISHPVSVIRYPLSAIAIASILIKAPPVIIFAP